MGDQMRTFSGPEAKLVAFGDRGTVNFSPWLPSMASSCVVVKLLACRARGEGFDSRPRRYNIRDWWSPASKSGYGWNGSGSFRPFNPFAVGRFAPGQFALRALKWRKTSKQLTNQPMTTENKKKPGKKGPPIKEFNPTEAIHMTKS